MNQVNEKCYFDGLEIMSSHLAANLDLSLSYYFPVDVM